MCEQPPYNILDRRIERELLPMAETFGLGIIPWSPIAGGLLSGKYRRDAPTPEDARYANVADNPIMQRRFADKERVYNVIDQLEPIAKEKGCTLAQLAVAWCAQQPAVTSPIIGPRTMEQLDDNLGALAVTLTDEDRQRIDEIVPPGRMVSPFYEASFGPSQYRW